ncbi:MAG: DNA ligase-associated DEXH box helicase [Bacteroidia bacterium]|nr:MAG: DNA ligase-associated DEXH box helicase [Bacteroidia bacterium]
MFNIHQWLKNKNWQAFHFQVECWQAIEAGKSGFLNAPTGSGKTYALWLGILKKLSEQKNKIGLKAIWITPLRALAQEIKNACEFPCVEYQLNIKVGVRTGDTKLKERAAQKKAMPDLLIITPESLHLLLSQKNHEEIFSSLQYVVVDEWHELLGSKRGVQVELALSRLRSINSTLQVWGISATIGNLKEAAAILHPQNKHIAFVQYNNEKEIEIKTLLPDTIDKMPWAGHIGIKLIEKVIPIIEQHQSVLIFTNTRSQSEIWYHALMGKAPHLAGLVALHHGSLSSEIRTWVENALHEGKLKAVVCTSSLDLGVDFRPVDCVIQIGSPKGVARFMQRAGRSGHQPLAKSKIYFLPTHALEIIEAAALRDAIKQKNIEQRIPYIRSFDVLIQYLTTLAVGDGFYPDKIFHEIKQTHCFESIRNEEFNWCLQFLVYGGNSLSAYDEFKKIEIENGKYVVKSRSIAMRHRMQIGTIVSDSMLTVKFLGGKKLGSIEEWFISKLKAGDIFWFAGRSLQFLQIKEMQVLVKNAGNKKGVIPAWMGGRMPLSSELSGMMQHKLQGYVENKHPNDELKDLIPLLELQEKRSSIINEKEFLIEEFSDKEGYHLFFYPIEGRFVHEGMAALFAHRISQIKPISFSIALNDYGFELLSDQEIPIQQALENNLFNTENLQNDIYKSVNITEMAKRRFRDIATISGLVFNGYPGKQKKTKHLQASSQLFFKVFEDYDKENLLLRQSFDEVLTFQLEESRLRKSLQKIQNKKVIIKKLPKPSPFSFPIMVDRLRERFSNEDLESRIERILKKYAD